MDFLISFDDLKAGNKALGKLAQAFRRAGAAVATTDTDPRTRRTSGVNYRQVQITFTDNQTVTLGVKTSGDIFEVKVNGAVLPIKNQGDQRKAVGEIVKALDAGRAKFQAKLARQKVALPQGITTAAPRMEQKLAEASAELDNRIAAAEARVAELRAELDEPAMDSADVLDGAKPTDLVKVYVRGEQGEYYISRADQIKDARFIPVRDKSGRKIKGMEVHIDNTYKTQEDADRASSKVKKGWGIMDSGQGERFEGIDDLISMAKNGKVWDGDLVSKAGRDSLVERGFAERGDGFNWLTEKGKEIAAALDSAKPFSVEKLPGTKGLAQRAVNSEQWLIETLEELGGLKRDEAVKAAKYFLKHKLVKLDPIGGRGQFKHGAFLEKDVIQRAATLDAVDVPTNTFDQPEVAEAQAIAARILSGDTFDDAQFSHALATLEVALNTVETNHPINLAEGNVEQAELEERAAKDFREAIRLLESKQTAAA